MRNEWFRQLETGGAGGITTRAYGLVENIGHPADDGGLVHKIELAVAPTSECTTSSWTGIRWNNWLRHQERNEENVENQEKVVYVVEDQSIPMYLEPDLQLLADAACDDVLANPAASGWTCGLYDTSRTSGTTSPADCLGYAGATAAWDPVGDAE